VQGTRKEGRLGKNYEGQPRNQYVEAEMSIAGLNLASVETRMPIPKSMPESLHLLLRLSVDDGAPPNTRNIV